MPIFSHSISATSLILLTCLSSINGHGRLIEPPSRASAWRYGFGTPPDYNDHELYCGGFTRQWQVNGGKCGECGDAWDLSQPRPHEHGGHWGQGVIVRKYEPSAPMLIRIELTASHMGYFEFRLCGEPKAKQPCFDKHLLEILSGSPAQPQPSDLVTRFYPRNGSRIYEIKANLPDIKCANCVLQWRYVAGNNWGTCDDGHSAVGCGPQEEFRSCSDIAIGVNISKPALRPIRPTTRTTLVPKTSTESTQTNDVEHTVSESYDYIPLLVSLLVLVFIFCCLFMWYLQSYHNKKFKQWFESITHIFNKKSNANANTNASIKNEGELDATVFANISTNIEQECRPIPPPRTRRNSKIRELDGNEP